MAELDIMNAFNDCVDRIAQGQSIDDCLRRYPQFTSTLRPMLEAGLLVQRMRIQPAEVQMAQNHARRRFEDALRAPPPRRTSVVRRVVYAMAAILIIGFISVGGLATVSQNSLPGDALYGAKTFTEGLQKSLFDSDDLEASFNQRRIQEIQQLLALGRSQEVAFNGMITSQTGSNWVIASLSIVVPNDVATATSVHVADQVAVVANTSTTSILTAMSIQVIESAETPIATPTVTLVPATAEPTQTASLTSTIAPSATATPTVTPTNSSTATSITNTPQPSPTTPVPTATRIPPTKVPTATIIPTIIIVTPTQCAPTRPDGWVSYKIRTGDTLSALASSGSATLAEVMAVNCITDASRIFVGETIYLPKAPSILPTATTGSSQNSGSGNTDSGSSGSGSNSSGGASPTDDHGGGSNSGSGGSGGGGSDDGGGHT